MTCSIPKRARRVRCIADANVLLPLLADGHAHQTLASDWWEACGEVLDQIPAAHAKRWYENVARREPSPDLWTDAWLAALAQAHVCEMVTFERGFGSFSKLKLRLLDPAG